MEIKLSQRVRTGRWGFVSLDIFWIVLLLAGVIFLAVRGIDLVDKRDKADRLQRELVAIEAAVKVVAEERELADGEIVKFEDWAPHLGKNLPKRLREDGLDQMGRRFGSQRVGELAVPDAKTAEDLEKFLKP